MLLEDYVSQIICDHEEEFHNIRSNYSEPLCALISMSCEFLSFIIDKKSEHLESILHPISTKQLIFLKYTHIFTCASQIGEN